LLESLDLDQHAIKGTEEDWNAALKQKKGAAAGVSIKVDRQPA
jgi:hypothetical protein